MNQATPSLSLPASDRAQSTAAADQAIVFFDGVCGMCSWSVDFIMQRDRNRYFQFAPLQGETARELLDSADTDHPTSVILKDADGEHRHSTAAIRILRRLGFGWRLLAGIVWLVPFPLRDLGYRLLAKSRYRLFGKKEVCRMPTPEEHGRILP